MTAPWIHLYVRRTIVQKANVRCRVYDVIDRARRPSLTDNQDQSHDGDFVQSLERGLSVIRAFDAEHPKLTLSEVATSTGLSRAAARRFLRTLVQLGYMRSDGSRFALRPKILELGYAYLSSLTRHTITSATALRRELRKIRSQGWALVDQELEEGLRSIAAPIRDADGQVIAAINVSTHAGRRTLNSIVEELLQPLLATARRIELDLARSRASVRARPDA